jgi:hypothetical protein
MHTCCVLLAVGVWRPKIIYFVCVPWLGLFGLMCIDGLGWWRFFREAFALFLKTFCHLSRMVRSLPKEFCWFGMRSFGSYGELGMIKKFPENQFSFEDVLERIK